MYDDDDFTLPPPGLLRTDIVNLGPVIDPPFSDARDWSEYLLPYETRPVDFEEVGPSLTEEAGRRALELAMASEDVRRELEGKRYEVMGVGLRSLDRETEHPVVVIYNYTDDVVIEAFVDLAENRLLRLASEDYQPPLSASELSQALELVRRDRRLAEAGIDVDTGVGLVVEEPNFRSPTYRHRLVDLRFGPEHRRIPTAWAIVDLSSQELLSTGMTERELS
jgi:hypothetical protein